MSQIWFIFGWLKMQKNLNILRTEHNFSAKKKCLICASDDTFLRSYCLVAEVIFNINAVTQTPLKYFLALNQSDVILEQ